MKDLKVTSAWGSVALHPMTSVLVRDREDATQKEGRHTREDGAETGGMRLRTRKEALRMPWSHQELQEGEVPPPP